MLTDIAVTVPAAVLASAVAASRHRESSNRAGLCEALLEAVRGHYAVAQIRERRATLLALLDHQVQPPLMDAPGEDPPADEGTVQ